MVSPRTIMSATRTGIYGTLAALFSINDPQSLQVLDAVIAGGVLADYGTWLAHSLLDLPNELWHGAYEGALNLVFGMFLFRHFQADAAYSGDAIAAGFLTCMVVLLAKMVFYATAFLHDMEADEE